MSSFPLLSVPLQLEPGAVAPSRANASDAGYDLRNRREVVEIAPGERAVVNTGVRMAIPEGFYGRIAPRSGLAVKHGIQVLAGVVDAGYRGEIMVCLLNTGNAAVKLDAGERVAQIIFERCHAADFSVVDSLAESERGAGGFGSSGRH